MSQTTQHLLYKEIGLFPNFPLLAKLLWLLFPTSLVSGSIPTSIFCLFIRNLLYQLRNIPKDFFFLFKDLVFLRKCFHFWPRGYWQFKVLLYSFRNVLVAYKGNNYSCVNQILHYCLFLDLRISFPLAVLWHK